MNYQCEVFCNSDESFNTQSCIKQEFPTDFTDPPSTVIEAKTLEVNWQVENNNTLLTFCI